MGNIKRFFCGFSFILCMVLVMGQANAVTIEYLDEDVDNTTSQAMIPYKPPVPDAVIEMSDDSIKKQGGKGAAAQILEEAEKQTDIVEEFKRDVWQSSLDEAAEKQAGFFGGMWIGFKNTMIFSGKKAAQIAKPVAVAAIKAKVWSWFI